MGGVASVERVPNMPAGQAITDMLPSRPAADAKRRPQPRGGNDAFGLALAASSQRSGIDTAPGLKVREAVRAETERAPHRAQPPARAEAAERSRADEAPGRQKHAADTDGNASPAADRSRDEAPASTDKAAAAPEQAASDKPAAASEAPAASNSTPTSDKPADLVAAAALAVAQLPQTPDQPAPTVAPAFPAVDPAVAAAAAAVVSTTIAPDAASGEAIAPVAALPAAAAPAASPTPEAIEAVASAHAGTAASQQNAPVKLPAAAGAEAADAVAGEGGQEQPAAPIAMTGAKPAEDAAGKTGADVAQNGEAKPDAKPEQVRAQGLAIAAAPLQRPEPQSQTDSGKPSVDPVAGIGQQPSGSSASQASTTPATTPQQAMARADAPVPLQALAVEIGMRAMRGAKEFQIRLDPEDLGRIDVRLEIAESGEVQAKVIVERVETLQLLQRDAKTLERAFDQAGLKTNGDALQFSLRDPGHQGQRNGERQPDEPGASRGRGRNDGTLGDDLPMVSAVYRAPATGAVDIRI